MQIRIVKRPLGEAPEHIRDAWIGLLLPVAPHFPRLVQYRGFGVVSGLPNWSGPRAANRLDQPGPEQGYAVESSGAIEALGAANAKAAEWWRTNAPHLLTPGRWLLFDEESCAVEDPAAPAR